MKTTAHLWLRRGAIGNMIIYSTIAYCCDFLIIIIIIVYEVRGNTYPMHHRVQFHMTIACSSNSPMNPELHYTVYMMRIQVRNRSGLSSTRSRLHAFENYLQSRGHKYWTASTNNSKLGLTWAWREHPVSSSD
jgi:hypothetical protein